jgi:hypothetical protein
MYYCPTPQNSHDFQFQPLFFKKNTANLHISRSFSKSPAHFIFLQFSHFH